MLILKHLYHQSDICKSYSFQIWIDRIITTDSDSCHRKWITVIVYSSYFVLLNIITSYPSLTKKAFIKTQTIFGLVLYIHTMLKILLVKLVLVAILLDRWVIGSKDVWTVLRIVKSFWLLSKVCCDSDKQDGLHFGWSGLDALHLLWSNNATT